MHDASSNEDDQDQEILCYCEWVRRDEVVAAIPYARDAKQLRENTRVCTVCFGCEGDLDEVLAEHGHRLGTAL